ncbi:MAG: DUF1987 domain-containing protein [Bacteroidia bacterium]|nr:DUF1987 domain-containing protein [Bacteroidia bacterium]
MDNPREYVPEIKYQDDSGQLWIAGESYHEYTSEVFQPVFEWLKKQTQKEGKSITLHFRMIYFNTSSARIFLEMMRILEHYQNKKKGKATVNWHYEKTDLDMLDSGERYAEDVKIPFTSFLIKQISALLRLTWPGFFSFSPVDKTGNGNEYQQNRKPKHHHKHSQGKTYLAFPVIYLKIVGFVSFQSPETIFGD